MEFNKDTRIGEILEKAPEKAEILINVGMHCMSSFTNGNIRRSM